MKTSHNALARRIAPLQNRGRTWRTTHALRRRTTDASPTSRSNPVAAGPPAVENRASTPGIRRMLAKVHAPFTEGISMKTERMVALMMMMGGSMALGTGPAFAAGDPHAVKVSVGYADSNH